MDVMKAMDGNKYLMSYALGDLPDAFCHCPRCRELNSDKTGKTYGSIFFDFLSEAAVRAAKKFPAMSVDYCAYHTYTPAPVGKEIPDNMVTELCLTGIEKPCNVHLDCALNNAGTWKKNLKDWSSLIGPDRLGIALYDSHNPFMVMDILAYLNRYSKRKMHLFTFSMIEQYVAARWNQGDDPEKIVEDYNNGVFGADAGKYVTAAQRLVYEYDKKYQHKPGEFTGSPGRMRHMESLDRKTFDAVYALFDKAEKAIRARKGDVVPLLWEKFEFMTTDLRKFPRSLCESDSELKAFALRVAEFIRISGPLVKSPKYPYSMAGTQFTDWRIPGRTFLLNYCGLNVPSTKKYWTDEPVVLEFMKDPVKAMAGSPEKTPGHWRFTNTILRGGENGKILRRQSSGKGRITASLELDHDLQGVVLMTLSGWDDEKPGRTTFRILVNGKEIFSGANTFPETASTAKTLPGQMSFIIPAGLLKKGENRIVMVNTVKDDPKRAVRQLKNPTKPEDGYMMKQDYYWGWLGIDELRLTAPDDEFRKFSSGASGTAWNVFRDFRPLGKITCSGGKVTIQPAGARYTGIIVTISGNRWIVPAGVKFKMRVRVTGRGRFNAGLIAYPADHRGVRLKVPMQYSLPRFQLTGQPQVLETTLVQRAYGYCCPIITVEKDGYAEISEFSLVPVK